MGIALITFMNFIHAEANLLKPAFTEKPKYTSTRDPSFFFF
jgi:hypothetical protein